MSTPPGRPVERFRGGMPLVADGATITSIFVAVLMVIPARMVLRGLPISLTPAEVIALCMMVWWLVAQLTTTLGAAKGANPVRTAVFCNIAAALATYAYGTANPLPADELRLADHAMVLVIAHLAITLLVCDGVRGAERIDLVLRTVVVAGAVVAAIGALQFLLGFDMTKYLQLPGLRFSAQYDYVLDRASFRRVGATMGHPIEFGVVCAMILPIAVHYGYRARSEGRSSAGWWACVALIASGLMFSVSRSALLGITAAAVVLFLGWPGWKRVRALWVTAGFLVVVKLAVPGLLGTFYGLFAHFGADSSVQYRTHDYANAMAQIGEHVWLGRGIGTWYAPKHQVFDNQYLLSLVERGVIGLVLLALLFGTAVYAAVRVRVTSADPKRRDLGLAVVAALVVPLVGSATFDLGAFHAAAGLSFLLMGIAGAMLRAESKADPISTVGSSGVPPTTPLPDRVR